ncbi:TetR/AcrR family transcriptional regulator [Zobellella sp. DQSA1]|uniref:TetR/AcrR family transcriptional regulator n=1 Tax=Zobellella sp. DQSA1 TaxID=3342386 RepID=UPI0035C0B288
MSYSKVHKSQSKARILASATELFCRYGFEKVSIAKIMKLARMTHGAFYAHFESKEALFNASILETFQRSRVARLAKGPFSVRHLTALVTNYLNLLALKERNIPGPETILFNEIGSERVEIKKLYEQAYQHMKAALGKRITALARLNKLPFEANPDMIGEKSRAIMASMIGAVAIARSITDEQEQQRVLMAGQKQILTILGIQDADLDQASSEACV